MSLEALVGGKSFCLHLIPCSGSDPLYFLTTAHLPQMSPIGTVT
jgi:hypothetical protein